MDSRTPCFIVLALTVGCVSASPLTVTATVNGVDPTTGVATVTPGEKVNVKVKVDVDSDNIIVEGVEFSSNPAVMGEILNDLLADELQLPRRLEDTTHSESYDLPGVMPAGEYNVAAVVRYTGSESGAEEYNGRIKVESMGFISMLLGLVVKTLPGFISKPLVGLFT